MTTIADERERARLEAARGGDENAFAALVQPYRGELHAHCYRMLGSLHDADDALQDAMLRAWRALGRFEGRSSLRAWLYKIATNTCLDLIARRPKRVLPIDHVGPSDASQGTGEPLTESVWIEPYPDELIGVGDGYAAPEARFERREGVELAFIAALQYLPPRQRAVLILREVLGYSAREVAATLETTTQSVNSALQRARATVDERLPESTQQSNLRTIGDGELTNVVETYMDAMHNGDVERIVSLLTEDAAWSMPPLTTWFRGRESITEFLRIGPLSGEWRWRRLATRANGQPAVAGYTWYEPTGDFRPFVLDVLTMRGGRIHEVTAFITRATEGEDREYYLRYPEQRADPQRTAAVFERFGLPPKLD